MNWLLRMLSSSIGKKIFMAISGLMLIGFLLVHLAGNFSIYGGKPALAVYAHTLHLAGPLIILAEIILGSIFAAHITLGTILFFKNRRARPRQYAVNQDRGGQTFSSVTMPYSGLLILGFLIFHLLDYTVQNYLNHWTGEELSLAVFQSFTSLGRVVFYVAMVAVVGIHINHGFWSLFQTLGIGSSRHTPALKKLATLLGFVFAVGFGLLPIYAMSFVK